ncbi:hemagglutinin repeat-containing protein [Sulfurimonas sp.]|uniref:hemagglutinin repeat-containing protein n=1 Tax=Sulfurimonas sp. TaxID=2022749 RepID=UPI00345CFE02
MSINTEETTTVEGANLNAQDTLNLKTKNLKVASVQNTSKTKTHSIGVSAGYGGGSLSSVGANMSNANSKSISIGVYK